MNTVFHFTGAEIGIVAKNLDIIFSGSSLRDEAPDIAFFKDPMLNQKTLKQALDYFNERWYKYNENGKVTIITDAKFYLPGAPHHPFTEYHLVTREPIRKFHKNTTVRLIVEPDRVHKLYEYVNHMVIMGYTSFFIQRDKCDSREENEAYCKEFNSQWHMIIEELLNKQRLRLDLSLQLPEQVYDNDDYYFMINEDTRFVLANGQHEVSQRMITEKMDEVVMPVIMTESCNLNCTYCYVTERGKLNWNIISDETINNLPNFVMMMLDRYQRVQLDLFGGEPLLQWGKCKQIIEAIEPIWIKNKDRVAIKILTNATLLTQKKLDYCRAKKFVDFHISRDGDKDSHNKTRVYKDGSGSYDDVKHAIGLYKETFKKKLNDMELNFVVSPDNVSEFYKSIVSYYDMGYNRFDMNVVKEDVWTDESIELYKEQYAKVVDYVCTRIEAGELFYCKYLLEPYALKNKTRSVCPAATGMFGVGPDGNLYPCQRFFNNKSGFVVGTVKDGINKESEIYKKIVNFNHSKLDKCKGCECEGVCHQHCLAAQYEIGQMFEYIDSNCTINIFNHQQSTAIFERLANVPMFKRLVPTLFSDR